MSAERSGVIAAARELAAADYRDGVKFQRNVYRHDSPGLPPSFFFRSYDDRHIPMGAEITAIVGCDGTLRWQEADA